MTTHDLTVRTYKDGTRIARCTCGRWQAQGRANDNLDAAHQLHQTNAQRADEEAA